MLAARSSRLILRLSRLLTPSVTSRSRFTVRICAIFVLRIPKWWPLYSLRVDCFMRSSKSIFFASTICALSSSLDMDLKSAALVGLSPAKESALASSPSARTMRRAPRCWTALRATTARAWWKNRGGWGRGRRSAGGAAGGTRAGARSGAADAMSARVIKLGRRGSRAARRGTRAGSRGSLARVGERGKKAQPPSDKGGWNDDDVASGARGLRSTRRLPRFTRRENRER
mmetsp:Transcript_8430/g.34010  ORF Transcript_8430/g.34010 Transcript_8430/m.34010 type:complete len:229 (-) Transcript_8430:315-1001(-)